MADWEDLTPKAGGWEDLAPKKKTILDQYEENVPRPLKAAVGGVEGLALGGIGAIEDIGRKAYSHVKGAITGQSPEATLEEGRQNEPLIHPVTEFGKLTAETIGQGFDYLKGKGGEQIEELRASRQKRFLEAAGQDPESPKHKQELIDDQAKARSIWEGVFDFEMGRQMVVSPLRAVDAKMKARAKADEAVAKYQKEQTISKGGWEDLVKGEEAKVQERSMQDMGAQGRDEGNIPDQNLRSRYAIEPAEKARLEAELNPADTSQGELFPKEGTIPADTNIGPSLGEAGRGREAPVPVEKELGAVVHTADLVDGVRQQVGDLGYRPEEPMPFNKALDPNRPNQENRRAALLDEALKDRGPSFWEPKIEQTPNLPRGPRRQRGVIDNDLLTFGTAGIWEAARKQYPNVKEAFSKLMEKFKGTFDEVNVDHAIRNAQDPKSRSTVVLMSPEDFHKMADKREFGLDTRTGKDNYFEGKRMQIREALQTKRGLFDLPSLDIATSGKDAVVVAHEGRHRMDVFNERGLDLIPVIVKDQSQRWGERSLHPDRMIGQDGQTMPMPKSLVYPEGKVRPQVPLSQRGAIGDWSKRIDKGAKAGNLAATILEAKKELSRETRPLSEIVKAGEIDPKTIQDLGIQRKGTDVLIDKTISILAQSKTGTGRLLKWAQDNRERITREKDIRIDKGVEELLTPWRKSDLPRWDVVGRAREKSALHTDLTQMKEVWHDRVGGDELTRSDFKTQRQWEIFEKSHQFIEKKFEEWNDKRGQAGLKPFPHISNYFPAIWEGDYRVWIKNANGENVGVRGFKNLVQAKLAKKYIQKQHPEYIVEDPSHIKVTEDYHDLSAFEEAMRLNSKDFKAFEELRKTYSRLMRQKGYGAHGLHRENLFGYLGMEEGKTGLKNSEKALEIWLRRGESHVANIETAKLQTDLHNELPMETQAKIPQAMEYLDDYLGNARGVHIYKALRGVDKAFQNVGKASTFGASAVSRTLSNVSGVGSLFKIMTPKFLAANVLQPTMILAKLRQLNIRLPESANFAESFAHGYMGTLWPDAVQKRLVDWAGENQHLNSTVVDMMRMRQEDLTTSAGSKFLDSGRLLLSQAEKHIVRIPALLAFEHALRKDFPNEVERFQVAADHLYYVVNYGHESSPLGYAKLGITGDAARPMKQFGHNYYGQFLEFIQGAKNRQEFTPLAMFLSQQGLLVGLRGLIGLAEVTAAITLANTLFGQDWPTPENWVLKSGMSDWAAFGAASTLLGADISSSINAPNIPQMVSFFPLSFAIDAGKSVSHYLLQLVKGHATENDLMTALMATTPNATHGWIEELFSKPGQPVPHSGTMNMKGSYVRTEGEKAIATLFSLKGLPEARKDAEMRTFKQMFANMANQRLEAIDVITDRVLNGKELDEDLVMLYVEQGGNPSRIGQDIEQRIKARALPYETQQLIGTMTPQKIRKLEMMKDVLDNKSKEGSGGGGGGQLDVNPESMDRVDLLNTNIDTRTAARIRAQEVGHSPEKIQEKIDGYQKRLDVRGKGALEGAARGMVRQEKKAWEDAKSFGAARVQNMADAGSNRLFEDEPGSLDRNNNTHHDGEGSNQFLSATTRYTDQFPKNAAIPMVQNQGELPAAGRPVPNAFMASDKLQAAALARLAKNPEKKAEFWGIMNHMSPEQQQSAWKAIYEQLENEKNHYRNTRGTM